ncbi:MAG: hypothetical protein HY347_10780 [candidate division NC10 bacterium]|nr:hypothetical protein [candidate division NC10 bacterium]
MKRAFVALLLLLGTLASGASMSFGADQESFPWLTQMPKAAEAAYAYFAELPEGPRTALSRWVEESWPAKIITLQLTEWEIEFHPDRPMAICRPTYATMLTDGRTLRLQPQYLVGFSEEGRVKGVRLVGVMVLSPPSAESEEVGSPGEPR